MRIVDGPSGEVLIEAVLEKKRLAGADLLYVHWLTLRHPRARFSDLRPQLPGQDVPGLGLAREITELLARMAARLGLEGLEDRTVPAFLAPVNLAAGASVTAAAVGDFNGDGFKEIVTAGTFSGGGRVTVQSRRRRSTASRWVST